MQIALIGIGKIANYQMQAITNTPGIKLIDAHDLDPNKAEELPGSVNFHNDLEKILHKCLRFENGLVELDHAKEVALLSLAGQETLAFNLATDKPRLVNHYCGVFSDLTAMFSKGEDNTELSESLHRLLFAALSH